jgi:hypothetical protein
MHFGRFGPRRANYLATQPFLSRAVYHSHFFDSGDGILLHSLK